MASVKTELKKLLRNEFVLTFFLWGLFLLQSSFDKHDPSISWADFFLTINYVLASLWINYVLIRKFFYKALYWQFLALLIITIIGCMLLEELVLEAIFYPGTDKANYFNPVYALIDISITLFVFIGFKFGVDALKRQEIINRLEKEKSDSQLNHLKSQISPHFLFNNLNNLYSKALENAPDTPELIHQLANIMRYMLYESKDLFVPLQKELQHVKDYISLQRVQLEERSEVDFQITGDENASFKIAPLLLIGFIENCFKHGFSELSSDAIIKVHIHIKGSVLHLLCSNPYSESPEAVNESLPKGIGLQNVKDRLSILYPNEHFLKISKHNQIFEVDLQLNLSYES